MTTCLLPRDLRAWAAFSEPGASTVYFEGHLAQSARSRPARAIRDEASRLSAQGLVTLSQRRRGENLYEYVAQRRAPASAPVVAALEVSAPASISVERQQPARSRQMSEPIQRLAYTIAEACAATGLSDDTLYRKHQAGEITMKKSGRRTLIPAADLERLIDNLPALPRR
ncbi:AlpA family transcriptional regulator [Caulobacter sp. B11]|uniref:helix-turn-helix transcriptional regulator n=1 Tax=Caulobacter sp. B11 TaxID=2048899 RepID=UPI00117D760C|nr:helix-turn-helix domain-containing protein [Caulobacter sp. B11]